ncbi:MAG: hypothetical protein IPO70_06795 [Bacteroidetes bacterium]|nr:hypothetical protein [Bacteroidota bacterium]
MKVQMFFNNIWGKKVDSERCIFEENTKHTNNLLPEFNFNFFNNACFQLFHYLIENYEKEGNIKYINIYYFLKQSAINDSEKYRFKMRIEKDYKPFIKKLYNKSITKFEKAQYAYDETELPILNDLEKDLIKLFN